MTMLSREAITFEPKALSEFQFLRKIVDYGLVIINAKTTSGTYCFVDKILTPFFRKLMERSPFSEEWSQIHTSESNEKFCLNIFKDSD
jgi:hypothetical protein